AIKNCMDMVACGGHLILLTPTNNYSGHGFYQFSAELFFRTLSHENGFEVEECLAWEQTPVPVYYRVRNPEKIKKWVHLVTRYPTLMMVRARKIRKVEGLTTPQQGGYVTLWESEQPGSAGSKVGREDKSPSVRKKTLERFYGGYPTASKPLWLIHRSHQVLRH